MENILKHAFRRVNQDEVVMRLSCRAYRGLRKDNIILYLRTKKRFLHDHPLLNQIRHFQRLLKREMKNIYVSGAGLENLVEAERRAQELEIEYIKHLSLY